jgi:hypothetical protein
MLASTGGYSSSQSNKVVRTIDTEGIITTVTGGGGPAILGRWRTDTKAGFKGASLGGIAIDKERNLYIADDGDQACAGLRSGADGS